jgi:formate-dependent nitrite reductase membrane component NrfD
MNLFVADPGWSWWIIFYFFLGGIAAGAYFAATLIDLVGTEADRKVARAGYWIAFPLIVVCGVLLTLDLHRPERFWHMLFRSEVVHEAIAKGWPWTSAGWNEAAHAPLLKFWSPMSAGSWALTLFGACSFLSFLGSLWPEGRLARWLRHGVIGKLLALVGCVTGLFVASYTGALVTATNQPIWSDTSWVAPLFLASAASTGIAVMILLARFTGADVSVLHRLGDADLYAIWLETVVFAVFIGSLSSLVSSMWHTPQGKLFLAGTALLALAAPLVLHLLGRRLGYVGAMAAALCVLAGGFVLRYGLLTTAPELLREEPALVHEQGAVEDRVRGGGPHFRISPEEGRERGGGGGADPGNKVNGEVEPRSKIFR